MRLIQTNDLQVRQTKSKKAVEHFKRCPLCGDTDLIRVSPEVVCSTCDWNSCMWSVSRGRMDNLHWATVEELRASGKFPVVVKPIQADEAEDIHLDIAVGEFR